MKNQPLETRARDFILRQESQAALPPGTGFAVSMIHQGDVLLRGTYGLRERDRELPVTSQTRFEMGSLTKALTATLLLMAQDEGKLDLSAPLNSKRTLIPFSDPETTRKVTILDILCHRTGLPSHDAYWYFASPSTPELAASIARMQLLPEGLGKVFCYNNMLYTTLGHLFEELAGEPFLTCLERKLLAPLGMARATALPPQPNEDWALPYVGSLRIPRKDVGPIQAAGGLRWSLEDSLRWMAFLLQGGKTPEGQALIKEESLAQLFKPQISAEGLGPIILQGLEGLGAVPSYGLGWFLGSFQGSPAAYHPSIIDGHTAATVLLLEKGLGVTVATNANIHPNPGLLCQELLGAFLESKEQKPEAPGSPTPSVEGRYADVAYGEIQVLGDVLHYHDYRWPLRWTGPETAEVTLKAFGLQIPVPVSFTFSQGRCEAFTVPFSLDPRIPPQRFVRLGAI